MPVPVIGSAVAHVSDPLTRSCAPPCCNGTSPGELLTSVTRAGLASSPPERAYACAKGRTVPTTIHWSFMGRTLGGQGALVLVAVQAYGAHRDPRLPESPRTFAHGPGRGSGLLQ